MDKIRTLAILSSIKKQLIFKMPLSELQNSAYLVIKTKEKCCADARPKKESVSSLNTMSECPHGL